jgi:flavin-dependent thymidylate synthase
MIEPKTETVELFSRLGKVGSVQAWDPWDSRKSVAHAKAWVAKVASISYGNTEAANPEHLFQKIVERGHLSCLEFVPMLAYGSDQGTSLPDQSWRKFNGVEDMVDEWGNGRGGSLEKDAAEVPASAFLVTCPLYTRSQWMRHRSFSYLEMSRRYTKGSKVSWSYYGHGTEFRAVGFTGPGGLMQHVPTNPLWSASSDDFHAACETEYQRRLGAGWPNEIARGCMPMEAMTTFWAAGFDRDWREFIKLRSDAHAQPEIRVYSDWIRDYLDSKEKNQ